MQDIKFDVPSAEYKDKPRVTKQKGKLLNFLNEQKYIIFAAIAFITMISGEIWSMTIKSGEINVRELTFQVILYTIFYYLVFFFMTGQGREKGRLTSAYLNARSDYDGVHEKIYDAGFVTFLQGFCRWKRDTVIKEMRQAIMLDGAISYDEYVENWQGKPRKIVRESELDKQTKNCIIEANAFKTPKLTASMLWDKTTFNEQIAWLTKSGKNKLLTTRITKALRVMLLATISVVVVYDNVARFDLSILIDVFSCLLSAFFGYLDGYSAYAVTEATCYETKTSLLNEAYDWAVEQNNKEKAE